jgi:hypothetical protein
MKVIQFVDMDKGPYKNIQDAIDDAKPGGIIKIGTGFYNKSLKIKYHSI